MVTSLALGWLFPCQDFSSHCINSFLLDLTQETKKLDHSQVPENDMHLSMAPFIWSILLQKPNTHLLLWLYVYKKIAAMAGNIAM